MSNLFSRIEICEAAGIGASTGGLRCFASPPLKKQLRDGAALELIPR